MKTTQILTFALLLFSLTAYNQVNKAIKVENFSSKEDFEIAQNYYFQGNDYYDDGIEWYDKALENYKKVHELIQDNAELNYKMGVCYYYANDHFHALEHYNKAYQLDPKVDELLMYRIAEAFQFKLQFEEAIKHYQKFIDTVEGTDAPTWKDKATRKIEECENGKELIKNFVGGLVVNLKKVNSKYMDHSPLVSADDKTMFFTSRRPTSIPEDVDPQGRSYEDVYIATKDENGNWQDAVNIGDPINTRNHDATIGLSADGKTLYIYDGKHNNGDILISKLEGDKWTTPVALPDPINTKYQENAISFTPDNKWAYFVSNRPGGVGQKDIWRAESDGKGGFKNAKALSNTINTKFNEQAVFISSDGKTMYFSSEGHKTMGGFDIFKSALNASGEWDEPQNIGYPVNTAGDDVFFVTSSDGTRAYFSSQKLNSLGEQDVYMYVFAESDQDEEAENIVIRGNVKDEKTGKSLPAVLTFTDTKTNEVIKVKSDPQTGEFLASVPKGKNYALNITSNGYTMLSESINPNDNQNKNFVLNLDMNQNSECKPIELQNVWFGFDKIELLPESHGELNQLAEFLKGCDNYMVEIGGYASSDGDYKYNVKLSKRRAEAVAAYLYTKGVNQASVKTVGYGPENPIGNNKTKAGRLKNRRVEFKLINK